MSNQSRKQRLGGDDAFIHAADEAQQWLGKHRLLALCAAVVVVLLALTGVAVGQVHKRRDTRAAQQFAAGFAALDGRLTDAASQAKRADAKAAAKAARAEAAAAAGDTDDDKELDAALEDDPAQLRFASEIERWQAAKQAFEAAEDSRGHAGTGALAGLLAADLEVKLGDADRAERHFDALKHDLRGDERLLFLAVERYAYLREARGDFAGALKALDEVTEARQSFYADRASLHKARLYEAQGDSFQAVALLQSMQQKFPRTSLGEEIALRLEALSEAAAQTPPPGQKIDAKESQAGGP